MAKQTDSRNIRKTLNLGWAQTHIPYTIHRTGVCEYVTKLSFLISSKEKKKERKKNK